VRTRVGFLRANILSNSILDKILDASVADYVEKYSIYIDLNPSSSFRPASFILGVDCYILNVFEEVITNTLGGSVI